MSTYVEINALGPLKNKLSNGMVLSTIETRSANKCNLKSTNGVEIKPESMKHGPGAQQKTMTKNIAQNITQFSAFDSQVGPAT